MPIEYIDPTTGKKMKGWTTEEFINNYQRGFTDGGGKINYNNRYSENDLKAAFDEGFASADKLISGALRAGYEEGFLNGHEQGTAQALSSFQGRLLSAEMKAQSKGYKLGFDAGYENGKIENQKNTAQNTHQQPVIKHTNNYYRPHIMKSMVTNVASFFKLQPSTLAKTGVFIAAPMALGMIINHQMRVTKKC